LKCKNALPVPNKKSVDSASTEYYVKDLERQRVGDNMLNMLDSKIESSLNGISIEKVRLFLERLSDSLPEEQFLELLSIFASSDLPVQPLEEPQSARLLTNQEEKIIRMLAEGKRNHQVADALFISEHTVRTHRNNIHKKLKICGKGINPVIYYERYVNSIAKEETA
jgi:DNA-binding NarL/FixJ family response regulator